MLRKRDLITPEVTDLAQRKSFEEFLQLTGKRGPRV